jgi:phage terminase Nu1 subunit (DNA packaging protein)
METCVLGEPYLTRDELREHVRVCPDTIKRWEKQGLPRHVWGASGRIVRYRLSGVEAWLGENAGP